MPRVRLLLLVCVPVLVATPVAAVTLGQVDDFETETTEDWQTGRSFIPVFVEVTGGPDGAGDAYIELVADGGAGAGSRLVAFNEAQWAGDYTSEGITRLLVDVRHGAGPDLHLRVSLYGNGNFLISDPAVVVDAQSDWQTIEISLEAQDLLWSDGFSVFAPNTEGALAVLSDAQGLRVLHSVALPTIGGGGARGERVAAELGVDNITAAPEPAPGMLSFLAAVTLAALVRLRGRA